MSWSYAWAIEKGRGKTESQDACFAASLDSGGIALAVADGAGSTALGGVGARAACRRFSELAHTLLDCRTQEEALEKSREAALQLAQEIRQEAERSDRPITDFATTFLGVVADAHKVVTLQVGDGAAVLGQGNCLDLVAFPTDSEFVNVTRFVTDADLVDRIRVDFRLEPVDRISAFTDGLQPLIVSERTQEPHYPFFERLFSALDVSSDSDYDPRASTWLARMLGDEPVQKRTDDDTSIVVARRKG